MGPALAELAVAGHAMGWFTLAEVGIAFAPATLAGCALRRRRAGREPGAFPVGRRA